MSVSQADKAAKFRALHDRPGAFDIDKAWDAGSARLLSHGIRHKRTAAALLPLPRKQLAPT